MATPCTPAPKSESVLIVKRDPTASERIVQALATALPNAATRSVRTGAEGRSWLSSISMLVLGLTLPDADGLDLIAAAVAGGGEAKRLVVSNRDNPQTRRVLRSYLDRGLIHGWFHLAFDIPAALPAALRTVADGGVYLNPNVFATNPVNAKATALASLTRTEKLVFAVAGAGHDDDTAGSILGINAGTVHCHKQTSCENSALIDTPI